MATPVKYYDKRVCFICQSQSRKYALIENYYGKERQLEEMILYVLKVKVVAGRICSSCDGKLLTVYKKCCELQSLYAASLPKIKCVKRLSKSPLRNETDINSFQLDADAVKLVEDTTASNSLEG
jgi:hypothetical protein